jgi:hypothetical protein
MLISDPDPPDADLTLISDPDPKPDINFGSDKVANGISVAHLLIYLSSKKLCPFQKIKNMIFFIYFNL